VERRDVLKPGVAASVSGAGCAALLGNPGAVSAVALDGFLSSHDGALGSLAVGITIGALVGITGIVGLILLAAGK
jgi:hypothetical protein